MGVILAFTVTLAGLALAAAILDSGTRGTGWAGPLREAARLLTQRRRHTVAADGLLARAGVCALLAAATLAGAAVLPLGERPLADMAVGIVWFNAMEAAVWAALWLTGWGANSFYPLVGGYRFLAQGLAYELPHMFALITVAAGAGSLRVPEVVAAQRGLWFAVAMPVAFAVYLLSALAMAFWGPLGTPVGVDVAGGVRAELSGPDLLIFQAGRYALLAVAAAAAVPFFLGGGAGPVLPAWAWTLVKALAVLALLVWAGRRTAGLRMDRFTEASWLVLIPAMLLQLLVTATLAVAAR
ncbi:NADH-quinone oxidoreductase subunit H [Spongiactinospora rosea]|uniref:NADH-quinone oxidoreductase subunit H n=1 Tax=Spongiactinospora rosea TaxID=2248750 RepID=A0A366LR31_9ACTN|nr:NADH-quinone oxidoreductase subunit H [Spongiactinospora rosea]